MANKATDIKLILRDPERLAEVLEKAARSAEKLKEQTQSAGNTAAKVIGPYTRLQQRADQLAAGTAPGNSTNQAQLFDLVHNAKQAQSRVNKLEHPPGFLHQTLSRMSRVPMDLSSGLNAGLSAVGAMGPEGKAVELLGNAAIEAVGKIRELADSAAASGRQMSQMRVSVGGSNLDSARITGMGANAGDVSGVRQRALSDPYAYSQAQGAGVSFMPGPMGEASAGKDFIRLLEGIRKQSEQQQRITLRTLGLEGFAGLMKVSNQTFEQMRSDSKLTASIMNDKFQVVGAEYDASKQRVETAKGNFGATAGKPYMEDLTNLNNTGADISNAISRFSTGYPLLTKMITRGLESLIPGFGAVSAFSEKYQEYKKGGDTSKEKERQVGSTDRRTLAMERLAAGGNVGSGPGFDAAIPAALQSGQYLAMAVAHHELAAMSLN